MRAQLAEAADRWGTPLYVTDLDIAAANLAAVGAALPGALVAYAVKANPDPQLLRRLVAAGAGCEVVTAVELALAIRAGCPAERIVMNGVGKTDAEAEAALRAGVLVNAESLDELDALLALGIPGARIGLRLNPGLEATTHAHLATGAATSKFGIPIATLPDALERFERASVVPDSVGAHIGSDIADAGMYAELAERLVRAAASARTTRIDLGGGWASIEVAAALGEAARRLRVIVEPGRSLVADAGWLITRVVRVQPRDAMTYLVADAGMSELIRPALYGADHPIALVAGGAPLAINGKIDLAGPVCEAGDVVAHDIGRWLDGEELARAGTGALLAVERAGAYGAAMASVYNGRPRPAEVVLEGGVARLSRRRETLEDLVSRDA